MAPAENRVPEHGEPVLRYLSFRRNRGCSRIAGSNRHFTVASRRTHDEYSKKTASNLLFMHVFCRCGSRVHVHRTLLYQIIYGTHRGSGRKFYPCPFRLIVFFKCRRLLVPEVEKKKPQTDPIPYGRGTCGICILQPFYHQPSFRFYRDDPVCIGVSAPDAHWVSDGNSVSIGDALSF